VLQDQQWALEGKAGVALACSGLEQVDSKGVRWMMGVIF
jgi:hypothetical protein